MDWLSALLPIILGALGSAAGPMGTAAGAAAGSAIAASRADVRLAARAAVLRPHRRHHPLHLRRHTKVTAVSPATPLILDLMREILDCFLASSPPILTGRTLFPRRRQDLRSLRNEADEKSNPRDHRSHLGRGGSHLGTVPRSFR